MPKASPFYLYPFVGEAILLQLPPTPRDLIQTQDDLVKWRQKHAVETNHEGYAVGTYIIDTAARLWLAHRRSEHVACARGGRVQAAGEIFLDGDPLIGRITNQSTGYCPSTSCWSAVFTCLANLGIAGPVAFDPAFEFRRCEQCRQIQIVKDDYFACHHCSAPLNPQWNLGEY